MMAIRLVPPARIEDSTRPSLAIFCHNVNGAHKRIRRFLQKPRAKELYWPQVDSLPQLDVHVFGPPNTLSGEVFAEMSIHELESMEYTFCGTQILLGDEDSQVKCRATMGGILQIEDLDGTYEFVGFTAAHGAYNISTYDEAQSDDDDTMSISDTSTSSLESLSGPDVNYQVPVSKGKSAARNARIEVPMPLHETDSDIWHSSTTSAIRKPLIYSALGSDQGPEFRDWALFPFPTEKVGPKPNRLLNQWPAPFLRSPELLHQMIGVGGHPVTIITGSFGLVQARLSNCLSRLLLPPGRSFVRTYTLELDDTSGEKSS